MDGLSGDSYPVPESMDGQLEGVYEHDENLPGLPAILGLSGHEDYLSDDFQKLLENFDSSEFCVSPEGADVMEVDGSTHAPAQFALSPDQANAQVGEGYNGDQMLEGDPSSPYHTPPTPMSNRSRSSSGEEGSVTSSSVTAASPTELQVPFASDTDYPLPDRREFRVIVSLVSTRVLDTRVTSENGCIIYYPRPGVTVDANQGQKKIEITTRISKIKEDGTSFEEEMAWRSGSHERYTRRILENMAEGLKVAANSMGSIYAKRLSMAKVFWTSTQEGGDQAIELERDVITCVFDAARFQTEYQTAVQRGTAATDVPRPAVRFCFAQKWNVTSEPFNGKLLTARVEPSRANKRVEWLLRESKNHSHYDSNHSGLIFISREAEKGE